MLSKYQIHHNSILTGAKDAFCLVCESHLRCEDDTRTHLDKPIHRKNLDGTQYFEKYKDEHVRKVKRGYFCEFCNLLIATAAKTGLHVVEPLHINNRGVKSLKRVGNAIVALNTIFINERAWQGLIDDTCVMCNEEFLDEKIHKTQASHILNLVQIKVEFAAGEAIFRRIDESSFQCLTCNLMVSTDAIKTHFTEQQHLDLLQKCKDVEVENNNSIEKTKEAKGATGTVDGNTNKSAKNTKTCESSKKPCDPNKWSAYDSTSESCTSEADDGDTKLQDDLIKMALKKAIPYADLSCNKNCPMYNEHKHKSKTDNKNAKTDKPKTEKADKKSEPLKVDSKKIEPKKVDSKKTEPQKVDSKKSESQKVDSKKTETHKADTKKTVSQNADTKKTVSQNADSKKTEFQKVDSKKAESQKADSKKVECQREKKQVNNKNSVNTFTKSTQINEEGSSCSDDSWSDCDSESDYLIVPDEEFGHKCELAKFALNNFLGTEAFPLKNGIPKFDINNLSKTVSENVKETNPDSKKNTKKSKTTKTDSGKVDSNKAATKKVDTKSGNEATGKTTDQKEVTKPDVNEMSSKATDQKEEDAKSGVSVTETTKKSADHSEESNKNIHSTFLDKTIEAKQMSAFYDDKAPDTKTENEPETESQNNPKDATVCDGCSGDTNENRPKANEFNDTKPETSTKDLKLQPQCEIDENIYIKPETKCEQTELAQCLESLEIKKEHKDKLLENAPEYQKNGVAVNFENELAFCKQCMEKITLHYSYIETHIQTHKDKPKKHEITNPILDRNNCTMALKSTKKNTKLDQNHNIKMRPIIIDTTKGEVGENHYLVPHIPIMKYSDEKEINIREPPKIEVVSIPETSDPAVFAKQHKLTYNKGNFDAFCRVCRVKLPSSIKCMKEHVYGNKHKKYEKIHEQKDLENNRSTTRKRFKYFGDDVVEIEHEELGGQDVVINDKYCITRHSFFMITDQFNRLRCQACEVNLHQSIVEDHANNDDHNNAMEEALVVLNLNNEFVRELRPGLYHCGYCNLIAGDYDNLRRHLECEDHRKNKADCMSRLRDHQPNIAETRRGQRNMIMQYVLLRMGFRCGVF